MAEDIYSRIRSLIADGTYIGGDVLPEGELANRLGVSRTPIREALRRLQAEGVIQREAYRRAVVTETDPDEVIHIFTMRAAVEPIAVGLAVQYVDEAFIAKLRDLHARMDGAIGEAEPDRRAYREYNAAFHRVIWAQGGNAMMADMINAIARRPVVSPTFNNWTRAELTRSNRQHGELVDALEARDAEWAETTMRAHLLSSRASYRRIGEDRRRAKGTANGAAAGVDTSAEDDADAR